MVYNHILQGSEATLNNAREHAQGLDWQEIEITEISMPKHYLFLESINGIDIWYDYTADYYFFTDKEE